MTKVKICGIQSLEEAQWAAAAGADALGFIFAPASKRYVEPSLVREISLRLPPFIAKVGVFVDTPPAQVFETARLCGLTAIQLHGTEEPQDYREIGLPILKALRVVLQDEILEPNEVEERQDEMGKSPCGGSASDEIRRWAGAVQGILVDSAYAGRFGGTGHALPWTDPKLQQVFAEIKAADIPLLLAGGLNPDNVQDGIREVQPYAVDVSSGVELAGRKNQGLIKAFINTTKSQS